MLNLTRLHLGIAHESQFQGLGIRSLEADVFELEIERIHPQRCQCGSRATFRCRYRSSPSWRPRSPAGLHSFSWSQTSECVRVSNPSRRNATAAHRIYRLNVRITRKRTWLGDL